MPCKPSFQHGFRDSCLLGLTVMLLLFEIISSRICNSLINKVDSFHTLFILLHLTLPHLIRRSTLTMPPPTPSLSSIPTSPIGPASSNTSPSVTPSPTPSNTPIPELSLYPFVPDPAPSTPSSPILTTTSLFLPYGWVRVRPLGALISALLLASLCVSVSMDIFRYALWPHSTERPFLVTVVGVVALLFNTVVLMLSHGGLLDIEGGFTCSTSARMGSFLKGLEGKGEAKIEESNVIEDDKDKARSLSLSKAVGRTVQDGALVLCNPGASSVLDSDCHSVDSPTPPLGLIPTTHTFVTWPHPKPVLQDSVNHRRQDCGGRRRSNPYAEVSEAGVHMGRGGSDTRIRTCPAVLAGTERSSLARWWWFCCLPGFITLVQALLGSVLVLANGLVFLQSDPDCLHSLGGCGLSIYLDPGFSALAVLIFLATALPQACRYGSLLMQGMPPHLAPEELSRHIAAVPGVLTVHHLHVWQLTESHLVASVHVHCSPGLGARGCSDLLAGVTAVLRSAGISCSTIQPEFLPVGLANVGTSQSGGIPPLPPVPYCSLACGTECAGKMCCTPREEGPRLLLSAGGVKEVKPLVLIIENIYH